jgi:RNA polymerase sigma-70 factor (ECF subfamily)
MDDAALIRSIAHGDREALATLYGRHAPWLQVRLRRRCPDDDVIAEALQETFVAA